MDQIEMIPLARIRRNEGQPRQHFGEEELQQLAASIEASGQLQPIVVRPVDGSFQIVAGERRLRALQMLGKKEAKCIVRELTEEEAFLLSLLENVQRADLNPVEEARAYEKALAMGLDMDEVARRVGVPGTQVQWHVEMLRASPTVLHLVEHGQMKATVAWYVSRLSPGSQHVALRRLTEKNLSYMESIGLLQAMYCEENQMELFTELKLSSEDLKAVRQAQSALQAACRAVRILQERLKDDPELVGRALAQMAAMDGQVYGLIRNLLAVRKMLAKRRMADKVRRGG